MNALDDLMRTADPAPVTDRHLDDRARADLDRILAADAITAVLGRKPRPLVRTTGFLGTVAGSGRPGCEPVRTAVADDGRPTGQPRTGHPAANGPIDPRTAAPSSPS